MPALYHAVCFFLLCFLMAGAGRAENPTPAFTPLPLLKVQGNQIVDEKGPTLALLDQAAWGEKYGMYVMVDWHSI